MKISREREKCIYDLEVLREGKSWRRGRYLD